MPQQLKLFISYRQADEKAFVEHIRTHFVFRYGRENVFMDFDSIPEFEQFEAFIRQKISEVDVVIAIIGHRWQSIWDEKAAAGKTDYVRIEIETAQKLGKLIAPICILNAPLPDIDRLPQALRSIFDTNAGRLRDGRDVMDSAQRLMDRIEAALAKRGAVRSAANPDAAAQLETTMTTAGEVDLDTLMDRYGEAAVHENLSDALFWLLQMRESGQMIPDFFEIDQRIDALETQIRLEEEARKRREVADFMFKFVRQMVKLREPASKIMTAVEKIWRVEPDYVPDDLKAAIQPLLRPAVVSIPKPRSKVLELLPRPFEWIDIPAGKVTLLNDWDDDGKVYLKKNQPQTFDVPAFTVAKYPITNAQFAKFIEAGGYKQKRWWTDAGWAQREKDKWEVPRYWTDAKWNGAEYPVVGVSWYESLAFSRWLSEISGKSVMLATEQQWQRAAQGDKGLIYPWGNDFDAARCNTRESNLGKTTPVTQYAGKGDSPFGVTDMSGNVWEWCLTDYSSGNIDLEGTGVRVLRGGSWYNDLDNARAALRGWNDPINGDVRLGFRVVLGSVPI